MNIRLTVLLQSRKWHMYLYDERYRTSTRYDESIDIGDEPKLHELISNAILHAYETAPPWRLFLLPDTSDTTATLVLTDGEQPWLDANEMENGPILSNLGTGGEELIDAAVTYLRMM